MPGWVRDRLELPERVKLVLFPRNMSALISLNERPELLEHRLLTYLEVVMPGVRGATLCGMNFNYERGRWQAIVAHGSFPPAVIGGSLEKVVVPEIEEVSGGT